MRITARPETMPGETPMPVNRVTTSQGVAFFPEPRGDQGDERLHGVALVSTVGGDRDRRPTGGGEQQDAHDALAVHFARVPGDSHVRLEPGRKVDESCRGPRVHAQLVYDSHGTG